jgi:hypothetical protein
LIFFLQTLLWSIAQCSTVNPSFRYLNLTTRNPPGPTSVLATAAVLLLCAFCTRTRSVHLSGPHNLVKVFLRMAQFPLAQCHQLRHQCLSICLFSQETNCHAKTVFNFGNRSRAAFVVFVKSVSKSASKSSTVIPPNIN